MQVIIAYDISSNRRRNQTVRLLADLGERIQYSVFECALSPSDLALLETRLSQIVNPRTDRVHIYPLCATCFSKARSLGAPYSSSTDW